MEPLHTLSSFPAARFIKEIGRGKKGARSLSRDDARQLYAAMLEGRVSDLELGGIMLAMRIKGESVDEIAGFIDAAEASFEKLAPPDGGAVPVIIPTYNGSRKMANLTPLLALLLARQGIPVFVHGVIHDQGRVTTAAIFQELGIPFALTTKHAELRLANREPVFMPIDNLAPRLSCLLGLRRILGVRNSTHTLVKIMQPFSGPALRLTSYTHPEYLAMLTDYFMNVVPLESGDAFLMRGTEGEPVANAKRAQQIDWFHERQCTVLMQKQEAADEKPALPADSDAKTTATWIQAALAGAQPVPEAILEQVEHCRYATGVIAGKKGISAG